MTAPTLIDTIRPDHPAGSAVRVLAHSGDMSFIEITSMAGATEDWSLQLDIETALAFAESIRVAAVTAMGRGSVAP